MIKKKQMWIADTNFEIQKQIKEKERLMIEKRKKIIQNEFYSCKAAGSAKTFSSFEAFQPEKIKCWWGFKTIFCIEMENNKKISLFFVSFSTFF